MTSRCAKRGVCENIKNGTQTLPILDGVQQYANADGTCQYGHGAATGTCSTSLTCGNTWHVCKCLGQDAASTQKGEDQMIRIVGGVFAILIGVAALIYMNTYGKAGKKDSGSSNSKRVKPGDFSDVRVGRSPRDKERDSAPACDAKKSSSRASGGATSSSKSSSQGKSDFDAFTCMATVLFPGGIILAGCALIVYGMEDGKGMTYYNECAERGGLEEGKRRLLNFLSAARSNLN